MPSPGAIARCGHVESEKSQAAPLHRPNDISRAWESNFFRDVMHLTRHPLTFTLPPGLTSAPSMTPLRQSLVGPLALRP